MDSKIKWDARSVCLFVVGFLISLFAMVLCFSALICPFARIPFLTSMVQFFSGFFFATLLVAVAYWCGRSGIFFARKWGRLK